MPHTVCKSTIMSSVACENLKPIHVHIHGICHNNTVWHKNADSQLYIYIYVFLFDIYVICVFDVIASCLKMK